MNSRLHVMMQFARFGVVGLIAALVHFSMVILVVQAFAIVPLVANVIAFLVAFQVSYFGHRLWTFKAGATDHREALPRLLLVQVINFSLNESIFYFFLLLNLPYQLALFITLSILPLFTFMTTKFWVFR